MTGLEIIELFHRNVDDDSRLSPQQEVQLMQHVYERILDDQEWSFAVKSFSGAIINGEVDLPEDFRTIAKTIDNYGMTVNGALVNGQWYNIYSIAYYNQIGTIGVFADYANNKLLFKGLSGTVEFIYNYMPEEFTINNYTTLSPIIPKRFQKAIAYGMAQDFYPIDGTEQQSSQAQVYKAYYSDEINRMKRAEFLNNVFQAN